MSTLMREKTDEELIKIIEAAPDNAAAKMAKEMLEYRKYIAQRKLNAGIFWLTIVLTISAMVQATMATIDVVVTIRTKSTNTVSGERGKVNAFGAPRREEPNPAPSADGRLRHPSSRPN